MWKHRLFLAALCLGLPALGLAQAPPDPCGPEELDAQRLAQHGLRLYKEAGALNEAGPRTKTYERALRCYQAVLRVGKDPVLIYHPLGLVYEKLERYVEAVEALERFLREVPEGQRRVGVTKQIDDKLRDLAQRVARLDIDTVAGLQVRVDQRPVGSAPLGRLITVLPGTHSVVVGDAERGTLGAQAVAEPGKVHRVDLSGWRPREQQQPVGAVAQVRAEGPAQAPARPIYKRWWFWGALGLVAAGVTTAAVVGSKPWETRPAGPVYDISF